MTTIEPEVLGRSNYKEGQSFGPKDDPDRTKVPHRLPDFCRKKMTQALWEERYARTEVVELISKEETFATALQNVFSPAECEGLIRMANEKKWSPALINIGGGYQKYLPDVRHHYRCVVDDELLGQFIFKAVSPWLPEKVQTRRLAGVNERLRFLCYNMPGDKFEAHFDGRFVHPVSGHHSRVTIQIYLNEEFEGGQTTFLGRNNQIGYKPVTGSVLLFSQDLEHEGSEVNSGIKYTCRTEAMYASESG